MQKTLLSKWDEIIEWDKQIPHIYNNSNVMKKRLEADLVKLPTVLQLKNKSTSINRFFEAKTI
jgi:hypothetical protein